MKIDTGRNEDAVLALMYLGLHDGQRTWKGFNWDALDRLCKKGLISDPKSNAKSVWLSDEALSRSEQLFRQMFANQDG